MSGDVLTATSAPTGPRRRPRLAPGVRLVGRTILAVIATGLVAVAVGVPAATVEGSLGPHRAEYSVLNRPYVGIDLGPIGSIYLDSPLPWPLGLEVRVQEIPAGLAAGGQDPAQALAEDLESYIQFFAQPELAVQDSVGALVDDAIRRVVLIWSMLLLGVAAGRLVYVHGPSQAALRATLGRPGVTALLVAVMASSVVAPLRDFAAVARAEGRRSPVLAGTLLADARIVGRVGDLLDTYGPYALAAIEENRAFYDEATANLAAAYEADVEPMAPAPVDVEQAPDAAGQAPDAAEQEAESGDAQEPMDGDAAEAVDASIPDPPPVGSPEDVVTLVLVSDFHCNVGMAPVIGEAVRRSGAQVVLNAGDTVISGTSVEQFCVDALARAVPPGTPLVVAPGNHDTEETAAQEGRAGAVVLAGEPIVVAGVRILGDAEPNITVVTSGDRRRSGYPSREEMARRLEERACQSELAGRPIDILLLHNPRAGIAPMNSGCIPLQLSGHFHRQVGPTPQGLGLLYVAGSVAGASAGQPSIGPLRSPGVMTVVRYDRAAKRPVHYRTITVGTDASAELGAWLPFPEPPLEPVSAELGLSDPAA